MAYFTDDEKILCPYCSHVFYKEDFYPGDGDETTIECGECGKEYTISTTMTRSFTTYCGGENKDDCDLVPVKDFNGGFKTYTRITDKGTEVLYYGECLRCEETRFVEKERLNFNKEIMK